MQLTEYYCLIIAAINQLIGTFEVVIDHIIYNYDGYLTCNL